MKFLTAQELKKWMDENRDFYLINVLDGEDFRRVHIEGSESIPVSGESFVAEVEALAGGKEATIVVYCSSLDCQSSPEAARKLDRAGFTDVYDFEGGIKEWLQAGYEVVRGAKQTTA